MQTKINRLRITPLLIGLLMVLLAIVVALIRPAMRASMKRTICASNLGRLGEAMYMYSQDTGGFPMWSGVDRTNTGRMRIFAPEDRGPFAPSTTGISSPTVDLWLLVRGNHVTTLQFICPMTMNQPMMVKETAAYYDFLTAVNLSYAYQFQHDPDCQAQGTNAEPIFPLMADGNPYIKGGISDSAATDRAGAGRGNSLNHGRNDQNVLFVDSHVVQSKGPDVGLVGAPSSGVSMARDNMYTTHAAGTPGDPGQAPTATSCNLGDGSDICLVP